MRIDFTNGLAFGLALFVGSVVGYILGVARKSPDPIAPRHANDAYDTAIDLKASPFPWPYKGGFHLSDHNPPIQVLYPPGQFPLVLEDGELDLHIDQYEQWWASLTPAERLAEQATIDAYVPEPESFG